MSSSPPRSNPRSAIVDHHEHLHRGLAEAVEKLWEETFTASEEERFLRVADVRRVVEREIVPHALAEEETLYRVASGIPELRLLVSAMSAEHQTLLGLATKLAADATAATRAALEFLTLFTAHLYKENELLLPGLESAGVDLEGVVRALHGAFEEQLVGSNNGASSNHDLVVDVRTAGTAGCATVVTQAFEALAPGRSLLLLADHDPTALKYLFAAEHPTAAWSPQHSGPPEWRVRITKAAETPATARA